MTDTFNIGSELTLIIPDNPGLIESNAIRIFENRITDRCPCSIQKVHASEYKKCDLSGYPIYIGSIQTNSIVSQIINELKLSPASQPDGYLLHVGDVTVVSGYDENGTLYGLGRLLRLMEFGESSITIKQHAETQAPVSSVRGVYFATHFNNWYESAPIDEFVQYVEDMALWGVNTLWTWFDMNWYPEDFWQNPDSRGMRMISKIRRIYEVGHQLGMTVGMTGLANEGFSHQPQGDLQVDPSVQRGGFYPFSQICPSKPAGLEMILANRRKILELIGPIDAFWYWPYDQGGCGCNQCMDENGWGKKFLEIGPKVADVVKELNPDASFIVSTWLMNDAEIGLVRDLMKSGADWFNGIILETKRLNEFQAGCGYGLSVFPEISMFDCFFTSYGCNGANPAPEKFAEEARHVARRGYGSVVYSEGIYEDINKIIWASIMWNPDRSADDVVREYLRYYFGARNEEIGSRVIHELEKTWGVFQLPKTSLEKTIEIMILLDEIGKSLPNANWCRWRWQMLADRAKIDYLMVKVGSDKELMKFAKELFDKAGYSDDSQEVRVDLEDFRGKLQARVGSVSELFRAYWEYLERFHLEHVMLIFKPDYFLGGNDYERLLQSCDDALSMESDEDMRRTFLKAIHRWFWFNEVGIDFLFL
ncbi:MAG: hypothetical protein ACYC0V_01105 [Armatimonadota bacterium]